MTPTEAYAATLAEVRRCENRAVDSNKPTMWAYFASVSDALEVEIGHLPRTDVLVEARCRRVFTLANDLAASPDTERQTLARWWALSVYAARILNRSGFGVPKRSLDWLRARRRWPSRREQERSAA